MESSGLMAVTTEEPMSPRNGPGRRYEARVRTERAVSGPLRSGAAVTRLTRPRAFHFATEQR
eukprot:SAG31_NODE_3808_length_3863_cov_4.036663_5_plen_62_part_00